MENREMKNLLIAILIVTLGSFGQSAYAGVIDTYLQDGLNVLEDDSGEVLLRFNEVSEDYDLVTTGDILVGDVIFGVLDFPTINGTNIDSAGDELDALYMVEVDDVADAGTAVSLGGTFFSYDAVDLTFVSVDASVWDSILGFDIIGDLETATSTTLTDAYAIFYDDAANNVDIFTQDLATAVANTLDGDLRFIIGETAGGQIFATDAPAAVDEFDPATQGGTPGVSTLGNFGFSGEFLWNDIGVADGDFFSGSGTNLVSSLAQIPIQDDTQSSFERVTVPEPSTLILFGIGLLAFGLRLNRKAM